MCGIVAVLARPSSRTPADPAALLDVVAAVTAGLGARPPGDVVRAGPDDLDRAAVRLRHVERELRGPSGLRTMLGDPGTLDRLERECQAGWDEVGRIETALDSVAADLAISIQESVSSALVRLKDAWWALSRDRLLSGRRGATLRGGRPLGGANLDGWWAVQAGLAALNRLEVRGRDSAGIHVTVAGVAADLSAAELAARTGGPLFPSGSVRVSDGTVGFVYKAAAEIGELGDNVRSLSAAISADPLLARLIEDPSARVTVVAHTRWASVGIISEPNAHPVDSEEIGRGRHLTWSPP